jgi:hypothetical protein
MTRNIIIKILIGPRKMMKKIIRNILSMKEGFGGMEEWRNGELFKIFIRYMRKLFLIMKILQIWRS